MRSWGGTLIWSDWCPSKRRRRYCTCAHQGHSQKVVVAAEGPVRGPFSLQLDIGLSVSRIERDERLPLGHPVLGVGPGCLSRPTVGWPFSCWTPRVLLSCLDSSSHLPPGHSVSPSPPNQAGCGSVVQTMFHGERWAVSSSNSTGVLQRLQAPRPGYGRAGAMTPVLHMRTGSPAALTDLNEATGVSNAEAQSLSDRNYLQ